MPLSSLADIAITNAPTSIQREDGFRIHTVTADLDLEVITSQEAANLLQSEILPRIQLVNPMLPMPIPEGVRCGWFNPDPRCLPPEFKKLQALSVDAQGRVHALDLFSAKVYVLDPADGNVFATYGEGGTGPGLLKLPMDVIVSSNGQAIVTAGDGARIEVLETP